LKISFDGKNQCKIVTYDNLRCPLNAMVTGNLRFNIEQAVTKAMVQLTFVPSFISMKGCFIVS
jgi:hypothetical protein